MDNVVNEIKNKLDLVEVVREYLSLTKAGSNYRACCPFHNEKTPSFMVSSDKQIWHCFGCHAGGDVFTFVQNIENITFPETLRLLAQKAGVVLRAQSKEFYEPKANILEILTLASKFFHHQLLKNPQSASAKVYLQKRQVNDFIISNYALGYALPEWDALYQFLKSRGYADKDIFDSGLTVKKDRGGYYDRFRDRLIFTIKNVSGDVIGFGGRQLTDNKEQAKYINSPQTGVYNKSQVLYGLFEGKKEIKEKKYLLVVEGYMDVLANHQVGLKNVVACSGTALTADHLRLIKRYTNNLIFCFDNDVAGQKALEKAVIMALPADFNIKVIVIDPQLGKDPDECIKKDLNAWISHIKTALPVFDFYFKQKLDKPENDINSKTQNMNFLLSLVKLLPDKIKQSHYVENLAAKSGLSSRILFEKIANLSAPAATVNQIASGNNEPAKKPVNAQEKLLALIIAYPEALKFVSKEIMPEMLVNEDCRFLYKNLVMYYTRYNQKLKENEQSVFWETDFLDGLKTVHDFNQNYINVFYRLSLLSSYEYSAFSKELLLKEVFYLIKIIKHDYFKQEISRLALRLKTETDPEQIALLTAKFNDLIAQNKT